MNTSQPFGTFAPSAPAAMLVSAARRTLLGRGSAKKFTAILLRRLTGNVIDVELWGGTARLYLDNGNELKAALQPQRYDPAELNILASAMTEPNAVFLDVGANAGLYSLNLALRLKTPAVVVAIEPNTDMVARVKTNLVSFNTHLPTDGIDVRIVQTALGDTTGTAFLDTTSEDPGHAHIVDQSEQGQAVPIQPLTDLLAAQGLSRIDALKIDVEGYEDRVLFPFFETAAPSLYPKAIVIEANANEWQRDCLALLLSRGYVEVGKTRNNHLLRLPKS